MAKGPAAHDIVEAFRRLGLPYDSTLRSPMAKARNEVAVALAADIPALEGLGRQEGPATLELLYNVKLLPTRIASTIGSLKTFGRDLDPIFTKDLRALDEHDFYRFGGFRLHGPHTLDLLHCLRDIYIDTECFRKLPVVAASLEIGPQEQDALIERLAKIVRSDPKARARLLQLFP